MKRKIAAIFAADVAGYSRLVAEDEEETLRRLASYRSVMDDFIARAGGRIFNTAGDAVLAEFSSAVEAVRCAIDIQESLRTRNMAYPASRQMNFRIGITIGDVVERDGDLLGDGVNIAARLEGIAPVGGICISRAVHEQVANKLSVHFSDMGEQQVKNIPTPVHAFHIEMRPDETRSGRRRGGEAGGRGAGRLDIAGCDCRARRRARCRRSRRLSGSEAECAATEPAYRGCRNFRRGTAGSGCAGPCSGGRDAGGAISVAPRRGACAGDDPLHCGSRP